MSFIKQEQRIRKRVKAIFNQEESDFDNKELWDDYLETSEDIIFSLSEGIDVPATEAKLSQHARQNQASIAAVAARKAERLRHKSGNTQPVTPPDQPAQQDIGYAAAPRLPPSKPLELPKLHESFTDAGPLDAASWADMAAASGWRSIFVTDRLHQAAFGPCNLLPQALAAD